MAYRPLSATSEILHKKKQGIAYPLSTSSRWIVDGNGQRVKLACVNWPSHLQTVVAEGLSKQPASAIAQKVLGMGFNCVRLTWPLDLATNDTLANVVTVRQSFQSLGLNDDIAGIQQHNPHIIDLPLIEALKTVVSVLGQNGVMVILDNHLTVPGWCCGADDGNGFFGDKFFDPTAWISGWKKMAAVFNGVSNVVGMSLRNELRGPRQNVDDWYKYMQQGGDAIHSVNPNVLVIFSGLGYDADLSFVQNRPDSLSFTGKLVFELHWYTWHGNIPWARSNLNDACHDFLSEVKNNGGFLLDKGFPLFLSEFGIDQAREDVGEIRYFTCILSWMAENDIDWSIWALTGSYYLRDGSHGMQEEFGILSQDWKYARNPKFLERLSFVQSSLRGPGKDQANVYNLIFHPLTGLCVRRNQLDKLSLALGQCQYQTEPWSYEQSNLKLQSKPLCLQAFGPGQAVKLSTDCSSPGSKWTAISMSQMHLSSTPNGTPSLCLDVDGSNNVVANTCKWFKIVSVSKKF